MNGKDATPNATEKSALPQPISSLTMFCSSVPRPAPPAASGNELM